MGVRFKVVVKDPDGTKQAYELKKKLLVGRKEPCEILLKGKIISSQHAKIEVLEDKVAVEDLGSANGVYVNGEKIDRPVFLAEGDLIQIGEYQIKVKKSEKEKDRDDARSSSPGRASREERVPVRVPEPEEAEEEEEKEAPVRSKARSTILDDRPPPRAPAGSKLDRETLRQIEDFEDDDLDEPGLSWKNPIHAPTSAIQEIEEVEEAQRADQETQSGERRAADESGESAEISAPDSAGESGAQGAHDDFSYLMVFLEPIRAYLTDATVSEVMINRFDEIYIERKGKLELTKSAFKSVMALDAAVQNIARSVGRRVDELNPQLDARLPDGSRVHAVLPPCARKGLTVAIRKFSKEKLTIEKLLEFGSLTQESALFLDAVVRLKKNIIVSGGTGSGKTSLLNCVSSLIPDEERILVIEDASELQLQQAHVVSFETRMADKKGRGLVTIRDLIRSALRLRPDRIIIGEIRGGEALDLLQAMNTGHGGSMSTIHANSTQDTLSRLETCTLMSGVELPHRAIRDQIASAVNMVVYTARLNDGSRKVTQISEILELGEDGKYKVNDVFSFKRKGVTPEGKILGALVPTGARPSFHDQFRYAGLKVPDSIYAPPA